MNVLKAIIVASLAVVSVASCKKGPVESVSLDTSLLMLTVGDAVELRATVIPEYASDKTLTWNSDNDLFATVDGNGKVTAVSVGEANIIVRSNDGGKADTCAVYVWADVKEDWVEIRIKYDGTSLSTLKWANQNLAISVSGNKVWKGANTSAVKVPGTDKDVIIGDYFQWGAYRGYCGDSTSVDKGLLTYESFSSSYDDSAQSPAFAFKDGKSFSIENAPYGDSLDYTKYTKIRGSVGDDRNVLELSDDVAAIIRGDNWRMPTMEELEAMQAATYWAWDADDKGYYVYAPNPAGDAGKVNEKGTGTSYVRTDALLFFPAAGYGIDSSLRYAGADGSYLSSTLFSRRRFNSYTLYFYNGGIDLPNCAKRYRHHGYSVRPVSD